MGNAIKKIDILEISNIIRSNDSEKIEEYLESHDLKDHFLARFIIDILDEDNKNTLQENLKILLKSKKTKLENYQILHILPYIYNKDNDELFKLALKKIKGNLKIEAALSIHGLNNNDISDILDNSSKKEFLEECFDYLIKSKDISFSNEVNCKILEASLHNDLYNTVLILLESKKFDINNVNISNITSIFTNKELIRSCKEKTSIEKLKIFLVVVSSMNIKHRDDFFNKINEISTSNNNLPLPFNTQYFKDLLCCDIIKSNDTVTFSTLIKNIKDSKDIDKSVKTAFFNKFEATEEYEQYIKLIGAIKSEKHSNKYLIDPFSNNVKDFLFAKTDKENNLNKNKNSRPK